MTHVCSLPATNCFASERLMTSVPMSSRTLEMIWGGGVEEGKGVGGTG
jgi:hypothetical protein